MVAIQRWGRSRCCNQSPCAACAKRLVVGSAVTRLDYYMYGAVQWTVLRRRSSSSSGGGGSSSGGSCRIGVVSGSDGGRASGYSATEMGAKGGASGVGYVPRGKSKEGDDQVLCIYLGGYEERKRHVDDGAGNNRGGCSIPRDSVFIEATGRSQVAVRSREDDVLLKYSRRPCDWSREEGVL
ncbi:hypothetical protein Hamer_G031248 [Homarus americanus]|uniref:Uncharacterized protein n=1 Tax=Homarus americanus TaxID=6706 RepID=A0A8J5TM91_HOMAM|nr:hypothetical protein Hamer_G031248 [Homarus americanus]